MEPTTEDSFRYQRNYASDNDGNDRYTRKLYTNIKDGEECLRKLQNEAEVSDGYQRSFQPQIGVNDTYQRELRVDDAKKDQMNLENEAGDEISSSSRKPGEPENDAYQRDVGNETVDSGGDGYQRKFPVEISELYVDDDDEEEQSPRRRISKRWMVCMAGFFLDIPFMGMVMSFGEMLPPLIDVLGEGTTAISWVGSFGFGMAYIGNPISSRLNDAFGTRRVAAFGVLLGGFALFLTSFVESAGLMFLTYSLMFGFATNLTYNPPLILTGSWFPEKYHVLATGLQVAGIPCGSLVMNPICQALLQSLGLRDTFRTLAAMVVLAGLPCCFVLSPAPVTRSTEFAMTVDEDDINDNIKARDSVWLDDMIRKTPDQTPKRRFRFCPNKICLNYFQKELWTDVVFLLFLFGQFVKGTGYVFPFIHLVSFMEDIGITATTASLVLTIKGAADMAGRSLAALLGERLPFDLVHIYVLATGIMAVTTFICSFVTEFGGMFFYAVFIGFWNGVYNALLFPVTTSLFSKDVVSQAWAFCQVPPGVAIVVGPAIAGAIYDATKSYQIDFYVNTGIFAVAMIIFTCIPFIRVMRTLYEAKGFSIRKRKPTIIELTKLCINELEKQKPADSARDDYGSF
ncbi:monocarboxylate transporter 13-like [Ptychodera flava]|uniref:monocarboxylate transporter 13-like n=1 Tax=Ptychodera flava TaxID=63121 RepID=UPI00396A1474